MKAWRLREKDKSSDEGGTEKPVTGDDNSFFHVTEEQLKWVIITRGGGLYEYRSPDVDDTTGTTGEPVIPGGELKDPPRPFFYEWKPTLDTSMIRPAGVTEPGALDPSPEDDGSTGATFGTFPSTGVPKLGIIGATPSLSKTTTMIGSVMVEGYSGVDDQGRRGDGIFGAVSVDSFDTRSS